MSILRSVLDVFAGQLTFLAREEERVTPAILQFYGELAARLQAITGCFNGGWEIQFIPSTAAGVSVSGRVMTAEGEGIRNARMVMTSGSLPEPRIVSTGTLGYYNFENLEAGHTYILTVNSKRYTFTAPSRVISLIDNISDADFVAEPLE